MPCKIPWFDVEIADGERLERLAVAEGEDFVGAYVAIGLPGGRHRVVHVWSAEQRSTDVFDGLSDAEYHHVIRVLESRMRAAPRFIDTDELDRALELARGAATRGRFSIESAGAPHEAEVAPGA